MEKTQFITLLLIATLSTHCTQKKVSEHDTDSVLGDFRKVETNYPFLWENANVYFLLIDRFRNGDTTNDFSFQRQKDGARLRNFEGGDIKGIIQKLDDGYFTELGITAIWFTPPIEQISGYTDEGTGKTYAYHGYWGRDWTAIDPNYGTMADLQELVKKAHDKGIRLLMDVVINHTGPVTPVDTQWPDSWVRTEPTCRYTNYENTTKCTLVENLPDVRTESDIAVELPEFLVNKWKKEGRYEQEIEELNEFFERTGYPRAPRYYFIKWLIDYVRELGIDGFRVDTAKHTDPELWRELFQEARKALAEWKESHPDKKPDDLPFFMVGEVYNYALSHGRDFPMGEGMSIDFFDHGFKSLINFAFKEDAKKDIDSVYKHYSEKLYSAEFEGKTIMNYLSSHDDGRPFDPDRQKPFETATKLLLAPGATQIYYGDEVARPLKIDGAVGDANLRSKMNWETEGQNEILAHWQKLGKFRKYHPAVGAGKHRRIDGNPYIFTRELKTDSIQDLVMVVMDESIEINAYDVFKNGDRVQDYYSGEVVIVDNGKLRFSNKAPLRLLGISGNQLSENRAP